ncbi:class I SAM-dependent methyltransferase [Candidatus Kaiserbacteria bacterium]|nr:class I SAM-dependent methyltransferase [Candidatus Kaiserbacteria bacterium]
MGEKAESANANITWWRENSPNWEYGEEMKISGLRGIFDELEAADKIGNRVVDVACGPMPVSMTLLQRKSDRKIVQIDVMDVGVDPRGFRYIRYDINNISNPRAFSTKKALVQSARHFGIDPRLGSDIAQTDTMLFFEILNYVNFREVLSNFSKYLKPGGRFIILNKPNRHPTDKVELLHPRGATSNIDLEHYLEGDFEIEQSLFPWGREEDVDNTPGEDLSMIFIVARKK